MMTGILISFFCVFMIVLLIFSLRERKSQFNSISYGDTIYYPSMSIFDTDDEVEGYDTVEKIERCKNGEIKYIYTTKGKRFGFLNFLRDDFALLDNNND